MERIIGIDALNNEAADQRVKLLSGKYPDFKFEHRPHDTRKQFVVIGVNQSMGQPLLDQMKRTAEGLDPVVEEVDLEDPKTTDGVTVGVNEAGPVGGGPAI